MPPLTLLYFIFLILHANQIHREFGPGKHFKLSVLYSMVTMTALAWMDA